MKIDNLIFKYKCKWWYPIKKKRIVFKPRGINYIKYQKQEGNLLTVVLENRKYPRLSIGDK